MRRAVLFAFLFAITACHRPSLTRSFGRLGGRVAVVVKPIAPRLHVQVDGRAVASTAMRQTGHGQIAAIVDGQPVQIQRHHTVAPVDEAPPVTEQPAPTTIVTHRTTAPKPVPVLHLQTRSGKHTCTAYESMEQCTAECTNTLRMSAMSTDPNAPQSCNCIETAGC
ncbi:MAG TPA: hypothetical protein VFQ53_26595 [Kofleriaceae bacterium]|nr:hypothetical protein [Kofleriaceae bacterium]